MKFHNAEADVFVPDELDIDKALSRTTHLAIGAHQDDIEIMAYHGVSECFGVEDRWFAGVVLTNGSGSPRVGVYEKCSDEDMQIIRRDEQRKAAQIGEYTAMLQLMYTSADIKNAENQYPVSDIQAILEISRPDVVYLHNPADKHDTHVAVLLRCLQAIRNMPAAERPGKVYGCEVWRDLDWLADDEKEVLPVDRHPDVSAALLSVYESQISGGKRYDKATEGRRLANATYHVSHGVDECAALSFAMDLTPLCGDDSVSVDSYVGGLIDKFREDVSSRINKLKERE